MIVRLPRGWRPSPVRPVGGACLLAAEGPAGTGGVRPGVMVELALVDASVERWRATELAALAGTGVAFDLEDHDSFDLLGQPTLYHRYAHLVAGRDVLCEEWAWCEHGVGVALTARVARADYWDLCDVFEDLAEEVSQQVADLVGSPAP